MFLDLLSLAQPVVTLAQSQLRLGELLRVLTQFGESDHSLVKVGGALEVGMFVEKLVGQRVVLLQGDGFIEVSVIVFLLIVLLIVQYLSDCSALIKVYFRSDSCCCSN